MNCFVQNYEQSSDVVLGWLQENIKHCFLMNEKEQLVILTFCKVSNYFSSSFKKCSLIVLLGCSIYLKMAKTSEESETEISASSSFVKIMKWYKLFFAKIARYSN